MSEVEQVSRATIRQLVLSGVAFFIVLLVALFLPAGDIRWAKGWLLVLALLGLMALGGLGNAVIHDTITVVSRR